MFLFGLSMGTGILNHITENIRPQCGRMRIAKSADHTVREEILRHGFYGFRKYRNLPSQVHTQILIEQADKAGIITYHHTAVAGTFCPDTRCCIESVIGQFFQ